MSKNDRPLPNGPFAVLRLSLHIEYHPTEAEARSRLSKLPAHERVGLVNRVTGITRCRRDHLQLVVEELQRAGTAPAQFLHTGSLWDYLKLRPRKGVGTARRR